MEFNEFKKLSKEEQKKVVEEEYNTFKVLFESDIDRILNFVNNQKLIGAFTVGIQNEEKKVPLAMFFKDLNEFMLYYESLIPLYLEYKAKKEYLNFLFSAYPVSLN